MQLWRLAIEDIWKVLLFSLVAGLGTGIGGLLAVIRKPGQRMFGFLVGMTAGVMITLSFLQLVNEAWELAGFWTATLGFAAGAFFMLALDMVLPHIRFGENENVRSVTTRPGPAGLRSRIRHRMRSSSQSTITNRPLMMSGVLLAVGITIHNLPEGFAVGAGVLHAPRFGLFIAIAILLHNIPEGIATALPLTASGVSRWNAFKVAFFSGLVEPLGALLAFFFLNFFDGLIPVSLAFAGGVMTFITLDELIPTARQYGHQHTTAVGIILGAISVFLLSGIFGI